MKFPVLLVALVLSAAVVATPAAAQTPAPAPVGARTAAILKQVEDLTRQALGQFDNLEFDAAKRLLADAETLLTKNYLTNHPVAARVAMAQGVVLISAFKDRFNGRRAFLRALAVEPTITIATIGASLSTPELEEIFASAQKEAATTRKAAPRPPTPPVGPPKPASQPVGPAKAGTLPPASAPGVAPSPTAAPPSGEEYEEGEGEPEEAEVDPREVRGILHNAVAEAVPGAQVRVRCVIGPDVNASKVFVFYRPAGREDWTPEMMSQQKGAWIAVIPSTVVKPPYVHYYIEVRDGRGRPQIASGNVIAPHQISVVKPQARPVAAVVPRRPLVEDELDVGARARMKKRRASSSNVPLWASLGIGTGFGGVAGKSDTENGASSGVASAPLHLTPEIGLRLSPNLGVSLQGRIQVLSGASEGGKMTGAGFARGYWFFGGEKLSPYVFLALGGGYVLHAGSVNSKADATKTVSDTFKMGPFLAGPGGGVTYKLTPQLSVLAELDVLVGAPTNTSFNADVNLGVSFAF